MRPDRQFAPRPLALTTLATSLGFALVQLDVSIVNIGLARIGAALGVGLAGLEWVVDAYTVAFASLMLSAGSLGDRIGAPAHLPARLRPVRGGVVRLRRRSGPGRADRGAGRPGRGGGRARAVLAGALEPRLSR